MNFVRAHLRRFSALALLAMAALALVPTLSHALAWASGTQRSWAEICTPQGTKLVAVDGAAAGDTSAPATAMHLEHCPLCAHGGPVLGLPPVPSALALPTGADGAAPPLFLHAPRTLFAWVSAQPRAPPFLS